MMQQFEQDDLDAGLLPGLNPDEELTHDVKTNGLGKDRPPDRTHEPSCVTI